MLCNSALDAALVLSKWSPIAGEAGAAAPGKAGAHALHEPAAGTLHEPAAGRPDADGMHGAGKARH